MEIYESRYYINDSWRSLLLLVITLFVKIHRSYVINSKKFLLEVYFINIAYSDAPRIFEDSNVPNILKVSEEFQIFQKFPKNMFKFYLYSRNVQIFQESKNFPQNISTRFSFFSGNCTKFSRIFQEFQNFQTAAKFESSSKLFTPLL